MKAAVFLLLALKVPACHTGAQCNIDNMVDLKVQAAVSSIGNCPSDLEASPPEIWLPAGGIRGVLHPGQSQATLPGCLSPWGTCLLPNRVQAHVLRLRNGLRLLGHSHQLHLPLPVRQHRLDGRALLQDRAGVMPRPNLGHRRAPPGLLPLQPPRHGPWHRTMLCPLCPVQ
ncbi:resistin isoform X2 [Trachemys scripta elegans]|nr:resistin isoform X2 [Trachemys scripta elegans]